MIETLEGHDFVLSDGRHAIMDRRDAQKLSHKADKKRTAQLGSLKKLVESAQYDHSVADVEHPKFNEFHYYAVTAKYGGERFDLWINVGTAKNDGKHHIYAITNKTEASTTKGVSRPVGDAIQNASATTSIPENAEKSNSFDKKFFR